MIPNPAYKGEWVHPLIPNPDYTEDKELYVRCRDCTHVGFELWQVKAGTIFDDILVSDSWEEAKAYAESTWGKKKGAEKEAYDAFQAAKAEEEKASAPDDEDDEDDHDEL